MKYFFIIILLLSGCVSGKMTVSEDKIGNPVCTFEYSSFLKDVQNPNVNLCGVQIGADKSGIDEEKISAVVKLILQ